MAKRAWLVAGQMKMRVMFDTAMRHITKLQ
jgi:hypothetical protein